MDEKIGNWPETWKVYDISEEPNVNEEQSDAETHGGEAFRAVPSDLDAAVLVERVTDAQPGSERVGWYVSAQESTGMIGDSDTKGYTTRWPEPYSSEDTEMNRKDAEKRINDIISDYENADDSGKIGYF